MKNNFPDVYYVNPTYYCINFTVIYNSTKTNCSLTHLNIYKTLETDFSSKKKNDTTCDTLAFQ